MFKCKLSSVFILAIPITAQLLFITLTIKFTYYNDLNKKKQQFVNFLKGLSVVYASSFFFLSI